MQGAADKIKRLRPHCRAICWCYASGASPPTVFGGPWHFENLVLTRIYISTIIDPPRSIPAPPTLFAHSLRPCASFGPRFVLGRKAHSSAAPIAVGRSRSAIRRMYHNGISFLHAHSCKLRAVSPHWQLPIYTQRIQPAVERLINAKQVMTTVIASGSGEGIYTGRVATSTFENYTRVYTRLYSGTPAKHFRSSDRRPQVCARYFLRLGEV